MKKHFNVVFCSLVFVFCFSYSFGQNNIDEILRDPSNNYFTIKQKAADYFARVGTVGTGYKQFKRWEFIVKNNVSPTGEIPNLEENNKQALTTYRTTTPPVTLSGNSNWIALGQANPTILAGGAQNGVGSIRNIEFDGSDIWLGTPGGGIWRANFLGGSSYSWSSTTDGLPNLAVQDVTIAPSTPSTIYALTGAIGSASGYRSTGVIKSTNGGSTWSQTGLSFPENGGEKGYKLLVHPTNSNIVWAATTLGLYRTTDGGTIWNLVTYSTTIAGAQLNFSSECYDIEWSAGSSTIMYAVSTGAYFYKSTDGGSTFLRVDRVPAGLPTTSGRISIGVTPANTNYIYLLYASGNPYQGLYLSTNAGTSFTLQSTTPNVLGSQGWRNNCIAVSPLNAANVYVGGLDVYKSTNSGVLFTQVSNWSTTNAANFCHADIFDLVCDATYVYAATDGGLYRMTRSIDTWVSLNNNMQISQNYRIGIDPTSSAAFVTSGTQDNGTYKNTGGVYTNIGGGDGMETIVNPTNTNVIYLSTQNGNFYRSDDGGTTNTFIRGGSGDWTTPAALRPGFNTHIYIGYINIDYNTTSGNGAWSTIATGFSNNIQSLEFAPSISTTLYATDGTTIKRFNLVAGVWSSTTINSNLPSLSNITEIAVDPTSSAHIVITCGGYSSTQKVYETFDANIASPTWSSITRNLPNVPINCVVIDNDANNTTYIGTDIGVFVKNDVTFNWIMYNNNLPTTRIYDIEINYNLVTNRVYVGTFGRGVFYTDVYTGCTASASLSGNITGLNYTEVSSTITSTQVLRGDAGTSVAYRAGSSITLNPGFSAPSGIKKFQAYLGGCTTSGNPPDPLRINNTGTEITKPNAEGDVPKRMNSNKRLQPTIIPLGNVHPEGETQSVSPKFKKIVLSPSPNTSAKPQGDN